MANKIKDKSLVLTYRKIGDIGAGKKRINREIILDILTVLFKEKKIEESRIMHEVRLNWKTFREYFDFLLEKDFIAKCADTEVRSYELTKRGEELLKRLREVENLLQ